MTFLNLKDISLLRSHDQIKVLSDIMLAATFIGIAPLASLVVKICGWPNGYLPLFQLHQVMSLRQNYNQLGIFLVKWLDSQ